MAWNHCRKMADYDVQETFTYLKLEMLARLILPTLYSKPLFLHLSNNAQKN